jgi:hypothetical protein
VPYVHTLDGVIPPGTQRIQFGSRVNTECHCSSVADLRVKGFRFIPERGSQITRHLSTEIEIHSWFGWRGEVEY